MAAAIGVAASIATLAITANGLIRRTGHSAQAYSNAEAAWKLGKVTMPASPNKSRWRSMPSRTGARSRT